MKIDHTNHEEDIVVELHPHDTWNVDITLAQIIVPLLKQLKETKHGAPYVDNKDVPKELHCTKTDEMEDVSEHPNFFKRWDWVLDEMIWAFTQHTYDDEEQFHHNSDNIEMKFEPYEGHKGWSVINFVKKDESKPEHWFDKKGYEKHSKRKANGRRLFAKYYVSLWD